MRTYANITRHLRGRRCKAACKPGRTNTKPITIRPYKTALFLQQTSGLKISFPLARNTASAWLGLGLRPLAIRYRHFQPLAACKASDHENPGSEGLVGSARLPEPTAHSTLCLHSLHGPQCAQGRHQAEAEPRGEERESSGSSQAKPCLAPYTCVL